MIQESGISHALLLDEQEIGRLRIDGDTTIRRRASTRLRMPIAFLCRSSTSLVATAQLTGSSRSDDAFEADWTFEDIEWLDRPLTLSNIGSGPLWVRLDQSQRAALCSPDSQDFVTPIAAPPSPTLSERTECNSEEAPSTTDLVDSNSNRSPLGVSSDDEKAHEASADHIALARARSVRLIPHGPISLTEARQLLVRLRDEEIKPVFSAVPAEKGILRRAMLHALLEEGITSQDDYTSLIPEELRLGTDPGQVAAFLDIIVEILAQVQESAASPRAAASKSLSVAAGSPWTDDELEAAVDSYNEMLACEAEGIPYNKAARIRALREGPLKQRTPSSVTLRWQNISHILFKNGRPFIAGLKPAANVGDHVERRLLQMLRSRKLL
ncbi:MAG: hypothetical protein ACK4SZ_02980 [Allosphingosinicella sp.]|uniref:hypothetical protein n=1 Tax=Allosphingosinicella sp. TaxID=2823234 RepID=UPI0039264840